MFDFKNDLVLPNIMFSVIYSRGAICIERHLVLRAGDIRCVYSKISRMHAREHIFARRVYIAPRQREPPFSLSSFLFSLPVPLGLRAYFTGFL